MDKDTSLQEGPSTSTGPLPGSSESGIERAREYPDPPQRPQHDGRTHCCSCYTKAVEYDYFDRRTAHDEDIKSVALRLLEIDIGKIDPRLKDKAERVLSLYLEPSLPRLQ